MHQPLPSPLHPATLEPLITTLQTRIDTTPEQFPPPDQPTDDTDTPTPARHIATRTALSLIVDTVLADTTQPHLRKELPTSESNRLESATATLLDAEHPARLLGHLFDTLLPQSSRRRNGQFHTPPAIADLMGHWLATPPFTRLLDPGPGTGTLTDSVLHSRPETAPTPHVIGIDADPLAARLGHAAIKIAGHDATIDTITGDFLTHSPTDINGGVDAIIANPPYVRHRDIPVDTKTRINDHCSATTQYDIPATSPLHAYFLYHAPQFLDTGGRCAVLTPSEPLETQYGTTLKRYLLNTLDITALVLFDRETSQFDDAVTTSLLWLLERPATTPVSTTTTCLRVDTHPGPQTLAAAITGETTGPTTWGYHTTIPQDDLDPTANWTTHFDPTHVDTTGCITLGDLATVTRGIVTGDNAFFCLTKSEITDWDIEPPYLAPVARRAASIDGYEYTHDDWAAQYAADDPVSLLYHVDALPPTATAAIDAADPSATPNAAAYLAHGKQDHDVHTGGVTGSRDPWYRVDRRDPPWLLATYMTKTRFRFIHNAAGARYLTNFLGCYLDADLSTTERAALAAFLNSRLATRLIRSNGRTHGDGLAKIEPTELQGLPIIDPRHLPHQILDRLATAWKHLRNTGPGQADHADALDAIDAALAAARQTDAAVPVEREGSA